MGLTRIKAKQISNIDYKQSCRVITASNITLSGGAPTLVDGVTLVRFDRVLVNGQTTGSENGIYKVLTLGTGSNGTWVRTSDANENGEIQAGLVVMISEGTLYADTQWKLTTNGIIVVGTTALTFEKNYSHSFGTVIGGGTNVVADSVADTIEIVGGTNVTVTADNSAKTVTITSAAGALLTQPDSYDTDITVDSSSASFLFDSATIGDSGSITIPDSSTLKVATLS